MYPWLSYVLTSLVLIPSAFAGTEGPKSGTVVGYAELLRRQKTNADGKALLPGTPALRTEYVANLHARAFAQLPERFTDEAIERAFDLLESVRSEMSFIAWKSYSFFPEFFVDPAERDFMFRSIAQTFGPEFVAGGPGHYVPNTEMMELTVALTNGILGEFELVDVLPSGASKADVLKRGRRRRRTEARERHEAALASVLEHRSADEIESAFATLHRLPTNDYAFESWVKYCYVRNTPGLQHDRKFNPTFYSEFLGPEFVVERDGVTEPNPAMVEYTLALTDGSLDHPRLRDRLPSGKTAAEVLDAERARRPRDIVIHVLARTAAASRREAITEPVGTYLQQVNPNYRIVTFELDDQPAGRGEKSAVLARDLRAWLGEHAGRVGLVVIEGAGLGALTDLTPWSGRPVLADALSPLRGRLAEDAQVVTTVKGVGNQVEAYAAASRMLLEDLGAPRGSVFAMTSPIGHIPGFHTKYLAGAQVALAGAVPTMITALLAGVDNPDHVVFAGLGVPLLYLAARPLYAMMSGGSLAKDHRHDAFVALGAGVVVLGSQLAAAGDPSLVIPSIGIGALAYIFGSAAQYGLVSLPNLWRAHRGRLNAGVRFNLGSDDEGAAEALRVDRDRARIFRCESSLMPATGPARANVAVVR